LLAVVEDDGRIRFVEKYLDFHLNRTICYEYPQGVYSKSLKSDLKILCCFFHSKYGYFVHSPDFNSDDKHWKIICGKVMLESTEFLHCTRVFFNFHTKFRRLDAEVDPLLHQILETFVSRYFLADLSHTI
jgi:hypothetical protein